VLLWAKDTQSCNRIQKPENSLNKFETLFTKG